jgi:hypothetical protein
LADAPLLVLASDFENKPLSLAPKHPGRQPASQTAQTKQEVGNRIVRVIVTQCCGVRTA